MDKIVIHSYCGILFSNQEEWTTHICNGMNESWKHHAKWKKPIIKHHIVYNSIYKKCSEQENLSTKSSLVFVQD